MTSEQPPRLRIADIIRDSGKMGSDQTGLSQDQLAAMAAAVSGGTAVTFLASEQLADQLAKRFPRLSTNASLQRDLDEHYEVAGRALILALQACGYTISAAFDTAGGAMLEVKKPMSLLAPAFALVITIVDGGATTHLAAQAQHVGLDWGQNAKLLAALFEKTNDYLKLFKS